MMKSSSSSSSLGPLPTEQTLSTKIDEVSAMESISELHHSPTTIVKSRDGDYPPPRSFHDVKNICFLETAKLWAIAGPIAFNLLCYYGINSATAIYVGRIGDVELSAVAISLSVIGNFSFGFLYGMASALETLCGQAFGAGQVGMLGIYLQRSWIIMTIASTCLLPVYIYAAPVLELLGQDENIAAVAGKFCIQIIPQMFSMAINFPTQKFLQAQSKVTFLSLFGFAMLASHVGLLGVFLKVFGRGMSSAAVAFNISSWVTTLGQLVYVVGWCRDGWNGLSWLAFKDLWSFAKLSMASAIMLCLEVWYMMTILVITGQLENAHECGWLGSNTVCWGQCSDKVRIAVLFATDSYFVDLTLEYLKIFSHLYHLGSVRVSNELGSAHPRAAKYAVIVAIVEALLLGMLFGTVIMAEKDNFAMIYTKSKEMQEAVSRLAFLLSITMVVNSVQHVISGVAVGGGWQALVAYINLFSYYVVGLPIGFLLGYRTSMGVKNVILLYIVYKTNRIEEVEQATDRIGQWTEEELVEIDEEKQDWTRTEDMDL
ncbi:hypothetical protein ACLB2K_069473 [Fragaria x ananassa]